MAPTRQKFTKTFDELVSGYYGRLDAHDPVTLEEVVTNYYGLRSAAGGTPAAPAVTMSRDDGEILKQPVTGRDSATPEPAVEPGFEEYVVCVGPPHLSRRRRPSPHHGCRRLLRPPPL